MTDTASKPAVEHDRRRQDALIFDTENVVFAYPRKKTGDRVAREELVAVLAIFNVKQIRAISAEDEPAFRRYLDARAASFRHPK